MLRLSIYDVVDLYCGTWTGYLNQKPGGRGLTNPLQDSAWELTVWEVLAERSWVVRIA